MSGRGRWSRIRALVRSGSVVDDERRVAGMVFWTRTVALLALAITTAVLPEVGSDRWPLLAVILFVGLPYNFGVCWYARRRRQFPVLMVVAESGLAGLVAIAFPVVWVPMIVMTVANLALHAVLFRRPLVYGGAGVAAVALTVAGLLEQPPLWTLGVAAMLVMTPSLIQVLTAVAEKERAARLRLSTMVDGVDAVLLEADPETGRFTYVSHQVEALLGYTAEEWLAEDDFWANHMHPDDARRSLRRVASALEADDDFDLEFRMISADGRVAWFHAKAKIERDIRGRPVNVRGVAVDITERRRAEEALRHQALHDALTGLPNRVLLQDRLRRAIADADRRREPFGFLLMDLDQFKEINDTLGHEHGDQLLQQIGARLRTALRESDTVARLGGDEFAVIVPEADREGSVIVAEKLQAALERSFHLEDLMVQARASIGIAVYPDQGADAEALVQRADVAMYTAKRNGGGHAVYDPAHDRFSVRRLALLGDLRRALDRDELELRYQPKLDVRSDEVMGVESLVRWRHPEHGLMGPDRFINLAEVAGLIQLLTAWVLDRALRQCRRWLNAGIELAVSVNISARDLHDPAFADRVADLLDRWFVPADRLVIEITEHEIMRDRAQATETLGRLAAMGVRVSIDDFGTGYSSLADLRQLPIDEIKIDKSFVTNMVTDVNDAVIVRSMVDLGHNLGINVVAEGVENIEIRRWLDDLGCDELQGFDICHPVPAPDLEMWLEARRRPLSNAIDLDDVASSL